jgi:hypothetical protein
MYGCPESQSRGWMESYLIANMTNYAIGDSYFDKFFHSFYHMSYYWETAMMTLRFCVKFRNETMLDKGQWIPGNYNIYKIGVSCPSGIFRFFSNLMNF